MKKVLMFGAAALMFNTAAYANGGTFQDADGSSTTLSWSSSSAGDDFEDAGSPISAAFTLHGDVTKTCSMQAVDNSSPGLSGNIDLGTIGIHAGDELSVSNLFTMVGAAHATVNSAAAGCNYNNTVKVEKDDIRGLVNSSPGNYDSAQFQANIPYSATASFTGVVTGTGTGSAQSVTVAANANSAQSNFGAWRSPFQLDVNVPVVTGKGLVGGTYQGTVTVSIAII